MSVPPSIMRAWQYSSTKGGIEKNLKINSSVKLPKHNANQHLVKVIATALNPVDYKPAENPLIGKLIPKPATPVCDYAGRIVTAAVGSSLKPGQLVFGVPGSSPLAGGALAEYLVVEQTGTVAIPDGVDVADAATIGIAGLTAWQSIVPRVKKGDKIFINGGSGGTGVYGIQIAKAVGCHVTTTCSTVNVELCKRLGADEVVDYKKTSVLEALKANEPKFDLVIDNVGNDMELYWKCHEYTNPDAVYVRVAGSPSLGQIAEIIKIKAIPGFLGGGKRKQEGFFAQPNVEQLTTMADWMKEGKLKAIIDQNFPFEEAPSAFEKLKTGRTKGKIVVTVAA
jgi:NADPH:quinone reductase-like Zn-dependent oxidoreductase